MSTNINNGNSQEISLDSRDKRTITEEEWIIETRREEWRLRWHERMEYRCTIINAKVYLLSVEKTAPNVVIIGRKSLIRYLSST